MKRKRRSHNKSDRHIHVVHATRHVFVDGCFAAYVCRCAVDFLEYEFSQRNPQVKTVTSKGSELDTITFRSEDPSGRKVTCRPY